MRVKMWNPSTQRHLCTFSRGSGCPLITSERCVWTHSCSKELDGSDFRCLEKLPLFRLISAGCRDVSLRLIVIWQQFVPSVFSPTSVLSISQFWAPLLASLSDNNPWGGGGINAAQISIFVLRASNPTFSLSSFTNIQSSAGISNKVPN